MPFRPLNFEVRAEATTVELIWNRSSVDIVDNYVLSWTYLSPCAPGSPKGVLLEGTANQYIAEGLEENSRYSFSLQARNSAGDSPEALLVVMTLTSGIDS